MMRIALDWFVNPDHVPLFAAGLADQLVQPADPDEPLAMVVDGRVDLALNYQPNVTLARSRGLPVHAVGLLIDQVLDTLMVRADGPIRAVSDLAGHRVAYAVEPFDRVMFQAMAQHAGLAPDSWTFVDVGFEFTRALLEDRVDAVMGAFRNYEVIEAEELGMPVRVFELADHGVPPFYQLVFVARDDVTAERARVLAETLARAAEGIALTRTDPLRAFAAYLRANPTHDDRFHRRAFAATVATFAASQRQDARRWREFGDFLRARGLLATVPAAADLFTNELAA
ncbi:MAG: ABC transporter substrate-binding protein [Chloroflexi bacterium]|nr:ABC transporter substrate-binding protein [Chloroflexota bacterium]